MRKLYYSISEVCQLVDEEQHILRYWEKEFPQLKPKKNRGGNRIYSQKDVNLIGAIKRLLRTDKMSLKNAKEKLSDIEFKHDEEGLFKELLIGEKLVMNDNAIVEKKQADLIISRQQAVELLNILRRFSRILGQEKQ